MHVVDRGTVNFLNCSARCWLWAWAPSSPWHPDHLWSPLPEERVLCNRHGSLICISTPLIPGNLVSVPVLCGGCKGGTVTSRLYDPAPLSSFGHKPGSLGIGVP